MGILRRELMPRETVDIAPDDPGLWEVLALWAVYGWEATGIFLTYANASTKRVRAEGRFDAPRGAAQVLVFLRHPTLPAAAAIAPVAWCRLPTSSRSGAAGTAGLGALLTYLSLSAVKTRSRLTPSTTDILAASTVASVVGLTVGSVRSAGIGAARPVSRDDVYRLVTATGFVVPALPWILADIGIDVTDLRLVGGPFLRDERLPTGETRPAVHLGHHHGIDGVVLTLTGLALSRTLDRLQPPLVRSGLSLYLAGLVVYGALRAAEDAWNEQIVKRGRTTRKVPLIVSNGRPARPRVWAGMLVAATLLHRLWRPGSAPREAPKAGRLV